MWMALAQTLLMLTFDMSLPAPIGAALQDSFKSNVTELVSHVKLQALVGVARERRDDARATRCRSRWVRRLCAAQEALADRLRRASVATSQSFTQSFTRQVNRVKVALGGDYRDEPGTTLVGHLVRYFPDEWANFVDRMSAMQAPPTIHPQLPVQVARPQGAPQDSVGVMELRKWGTCRGDRSSKTHMLPPPTPPACLSYYADRLHSHAAHGGRARLPGCTQLPCGCRPSIAHWWE